MKNLTQVLFALFCLCMPALLHAQRDDSKYLAGAVPEADGKVVFTKDFSIPGMSQDTIYSRLLKWMDTRLAKNENTSRVVYSDREKGQIVGMGDEWIVFSSTALSLDRTKILYQLTLTCQPEKCTLEVEKIRFSYREGKEKYTAEEWITDKYALNKSKTKLVRGLAKWRRKTVDFVDDLCVDITEALSASTAAKAPAVEKKEEKKAETALVNSGTTVITPKTQVTVETPKTSATPVAATESAQRLAQRVDLPALRGGADVAARVRALVPHTPTHTVLHVLQHAGNSVDLALRQHLHGLLACLAVDNRVQVFVREVQLRRLRDRPQRADGGLFAPSPCCCLSEGS